MTISIYRRDGAILFSSPTAKDAREALHEAWFNDVELHYAVLTKYDLNGLDLTGMDLAGSDFTGSNLQDVNFSRANLIGCNFKNTNLSGADFSRADISNIITAPQWIIQGQVRSDGRAFFLQRLTEDECPMIKSGPIYFSILSAIAWYSAVEGTRGNREETLTIIQAMVDTMKALGLK